MAAKSDNFVRCFDVSDPQKHPKGHTIYKVIFKKFSKKTTDLVEEILIWKRYNDFKKLYKILQEWHQKLKKHDDFPPFAKATVFGRFEDAVIEERRHCAFELLAFAGSHHHLYKHPAFLKFFEGGEKVNPGCEIDKIEVLLPQRQHLTKRNSSDSLTNTASTSAVDEIPSAENRLGGVWQYRQSMDNISLNSNELEGSEEDSDFTDESTLSTPLPDSDMSFFDPLNEAPEACMTGEEFSNTWLFSAMSVCAELDDKSAEPSPQHQPMDTQVLSSKDLMAKELEEMLSGTRTTENYRTELPYSSFSPTLQQRQVSDSSTSQNQSASMSKGLSKAKNVLSRTMEAIANRSRAVSADGVSTMDLGGREHYIYQAASQISSAQECEANGSYEIAFGNYKNGVAILLKGVQGDVNKARREAVRKKTAQYLLKAEDLYNRHLKPNIDDEQRWGHNSKFSPASDLDPGVAFFQGPTSELKNYQVLGIVDDVMLVLDKNTSTESTYVMKTLAKSAGMLQSSKKNIIPQNIPYMVRLNRYYNTDCSIHLLLQHASGGKLWNYISAYLNQNLGDDKRDRQFENMSDEVYTGHKVTNAGTDYCDNVECFPVNPDNTCGSSTLDIECSTSYAELMNVYRSESVKEALGPHVNLMSETSDVSISSVTTVSGHMTENAAKSSNLELSPEAGEVIKKSSCLQLRSFSSLDDDSFSSDAVGLTPVTLPVGANLFSDILNGAAMKPGLENYSIASIDSDRRHSSTPSWNAFELGDTSVRQVETPPILPNCPRKDLDQQDDIRLSPVRKYSLEGFLDDIPENDDIYDNIIQLDTEGQEVGTKERCDNPPRGKSGASTGVVEPGDGLPSTKELLSNARQLLMSVDETLKGKDVSPVEDGDLVVGNRENDNLPEKRLSTFDDVFVDKKSDQFEADLVPDDDKLSEDSSEPCIYDFNKPVYTDSDSLLSADSSKFNTLPEEKKVDAGHLSSDMKYKKVTSAITNNFLEESGSTITASSPSNTHSQTNSVLRGQEALIVIQAKSRKLDRSFSNSEGRFSLGSSSKGRKRNFSSVFSQLDQMSSVSDSQVKLPESCVQQWGAEIVCAISKLHSLGITCRDLRPDNILLGERGHILLTYFSSWIEVQRELHIDALEGLYCAPELWVLSESVSPACDWWSFGAVLYELLTCKALHSCHPSGINSHTQLYIPDHVSAEGQSILKELLRYHASERLGSGISGGDEVKMHPYFQGIDWENIYFTEK